MTTRELAEHAKVTIRTIKRWVKHGVLGVYLNTRSVGRRVEIDRADYEAFNRAIEARRRGRRPVKVEI